MRIVEWVEPYYTHPDGHTIGPVFLRLSAENAIQYRRTMMEKQGYGFDYGSDDEHLDDFVTVHFGKIIEVDD